MSYRVEIRPAARRQIKKLPREVQAKVLSRLTCLAEDPRPAGAEALQGYQELYRLRVGQYRVLYEIHDGVLVVVVVRVGHRKEVYQNLSRA